MANFVKIRSAGEKSMSERRTFVDRALAGDVYDLGTIQADIDAWHDAPEDEVSLNEWLGLTKHEYALFVEQSSALGPILSARKYGLDLATFLQVTEDAVPLAARGGSAEETAKLVAWLKKTGRI
jgi:hypothetical protein